MNITFETSTFLNGEETPVTVTALIRQEAYDTPPRQTCIVADITRIMGADGSEVCVTADQHGYLEDEALVQAEANVEAEMNDEPNEL